MSDEPFVPVDFAVPALTGQPDPGRDLATGDVARFSVTFGRGLPIDIALTAWA